MNGEIDYDSEKRPATPKHPQPDEEFKAVPSVSKLQDLQLDLNPDLSDDDESVQTTKDKSSKTNTNERLIYQDLVDTDVITSEELLPANVAESSRNNKPIHANIGKDNEEEDIEIDEEMFESDGDLDGIENDDDDEDEFETVATAKNVLGCLAVTEIPESQHKRTLEEIYEYEKFESETEQHPFSDFEAQSPLIMSDTGITDKDVFKTSQKKRLSSSQNSRLIAYIDNELLSIQRKFVQSFNVPQDSSDQNQKHLQKLGYRTLPELLADLNRITDFIWYTVKITQRANSQASRSFFQGQYFIRIAGDLVDYLQKFSIDKDSLRELILFIQKLDSIFINIIDNLNGFDSTEKVRLASITERTRIAVINATISFKINQYKYDIGKLYEELIDRIS